jgi:hypothetical protein
MHQFRVLNQSFELPERWAELTARQLHAITPYLLQPATDWKMRVAALLKLAPVLSHKRLRQLGQSDSEYLVRCLEWIWTTPMDKCPIEFFEYEGRQYWLPDPVLENLVGIEYVSAEHHFKQFARDKPTPGALDSLVATICRPVKKNLDESDPEWDGDKREKFNSKIAERRAVEFKDLPLPTKQLVLQFYIGADRAFHERYKELYKAPGGGKPGRPNSFGTLGILDALATEGVFGTFDQVCFTNVHTLFFHLLKAKRDEQNEVPV